MHQSWKTLLADEFEKPYFKQLVEFVHTERKSNEVFPTPGDVFSAFAATGFDDVKVVILGQDPYHGVGQAHGLSFSVKPGVARPPSLTNIYSELKTDVGFESPKHGYLMPWAERGVFLLNSVLTVRAHEAGSHQKRGWETFTDHVIQRLSQREKPMVFILWGRYAREKSVFINQAKHSVIESAHPSPMSAANGFFGSRPFSKANAALAEKGLTPVDWQLPASV